LSRTVGLFGFTEGWTVDSLRTVAAEFGAMVAIAAAVVVRRDRMLLRSMVPLRVKSSRRRP
ncbi:MAG: hypothetical protein ACRDRT_18005, partial [Pseudonocardiaceae bacterium]